MFWRFSAQNSVAYDRTLPRLTPLVSWLIRGWSTIVAAPDTFILINTHIFPSFIELDDGKICRKALYLMVKTMVSCRFSLKPIQWIMFEDNVGHLKLLGHRPARMVPSPALVSAESTMASARSTAEEPELGAHCYSICIIYHNIILIYIIYHNYIYNIHILWARKSLAATSALWTSVECFGSEWADRSSVSRSCSAEDGQRLERCRLCFSASTCRNFQWIGLRENLQESPIFNGKIYGFL